MRDQLAGGSPVGGGLRIGGDQHMRLVAGPAHDAVGALPREPVASHDELRINASAVADTEIRAHGRRQAGALQHGLAQFAVVAETARPWRSENSGNVGRD